MSKNNVASGTSHREVNVRVLRCMYATDVKVEMLEEAELHETVKIMIFLGNRRGLKFHHQAPFRMSSTR